MGEPKRQVPLPIEYASMRVESLPDAVCTTAFVVGIVGLVIPFVGIVAIVLGAIGLRRRDFDRSSAPGRLADAGLTCGIFGTLFFLTIVARLLL